MAYYSDVKGIRIFDRDDYEARGGAIPSTLGVIAGAVLVALATALILYVIDKILRKRKQA